jgi:hypothetical protein
LRRQRAEEREMEQIYVKMKNVKLLRALTHLINHQHKVGYDIAHGRIKAQGASTTRGQLGAGDRVSTCKERHIVAKADKVFGQIGNDPFSAAIEPRRNALNKWGDLCDLHDVLKSPDDTNAGGAVQLQFYKTSVNKSVSSRDKKALRLPRPSPATGARLDFATLDHRLTLDQDPTLSV